MEEIKEDIAISVEHICKVYRLYDKPMDRLKEALKLTRKKKYHEAYALSDVSFDIKRGECVGIIGTNGSGKSTILKIITGVLNPTSGDVKVDGRISALLELGAGFNMEYSGIENIYLNGTMNGFTNAEIEARMQDILDFADIGDYVKQPVKTYSSGMFVRLAFSVAINIDPEILIVDEALSVGDVFFQAKCYHKFEEFKKMGKTIIIVSHDLSSIAKYCDRVVLLNQGIKLGEGQPKEMIDDFKRVLVGQYELPNGKGAGNLAQDEDIKEAVEKKNAEQKLDRQNGTNTLEYGTKDADIEEIYIMDDKGVQ
jgi:teichoic acid transport system ATP-binding protein